MKHGRLLLLCTAAVFIAGGCDTSGPNWTPPRRQPADGGARAAANSGGTRTAANSGATRGAANSGAIHAYVHLDELRPVMDVGILVSAPDGSTLVRTADKCGLAVFDQLAPGDYTVRAAHDGRNGPAASVYVDDLYDTPVELTAPPDIAPPLRRGRILCRPKFLSGPDPPYPARVGTHGICFVARCVIEKDGDVSRWASLDPPSDIDDATIAALKQRKYRPYVCKGRPEAADYTFRVAFRPPQRLRLRRRERQRLTSRAIKNARELQCLPGVRQMP